jgi:hypothetical protein
MNECAQGVDVALKKAAPSWLPAPFVGLNAISSRGVWSSVRRHCAATFYCISWNELRTDVWP